MTRTPLRRLTPLRALRWMRRRPARRLSRPDADAARLDFARLQWCAALTLRYQTPCAGHMQACHEGRNGILIRGTALKAPDSETIGMCSRHHDDWTNHRGVFAGWSKERRRTWAGLRSLRADVGDLSVHRDGADSGIRQAVGLDQREARPRLGGQSVLLVRLVQAGDAMIVELTAEQARDLRDALEREIERRQKAFESLDIGSRNAHAPALVSLETVLAKLVTP